MIVSSEILELAAALITIMLVVAQVLIFIEENKKWNKDNICVLILAILSIIIYAITLVTADSFESWALKTSLNMTTICSATMIVLASMDCLWQSYWSRMQEGL